MRLSKIALKNTRLNNLGALYPAQDILLQTGQMVRYGSGVYGLDTIPHRVQQKIEQIIREELDKIDCNEVSLPVLQQKDVWQQSGRWDKYVSDGTMFTIKTKDDEYCLAPTAEEAIIKFIEQRIASYKNLPVTFYQFGQKFRNEIRCRGYLNRGKSFQMMDAYSFSADEKSMSESYNTIREVFFRICKRFGLDVMTVAADNGEMGGKKSEEFMVATPSGEDLILVDERTGLGFNKELLERPDAKKYLQSFGIRDLSQLKEKRATEFGHIFQLGTKYSETMNIKFPDKDCQQKPYHMGCYGIGVSRALGIIYENNAIIENDKVTGVSLPPELSPYALHIVSKTDNQQRTAEAERLYADLMVAGVPAIIDDTDNAIGAKLKNCRALGTPYAAIFGDKLTTGSVEIEKTKTGEKKVLSTDAVINTVSSKVDFFTQDR